MWVGGGPWAINSCNLLFPLEYHPMKKILLPAMHQKPPNLPSSAWNPWIDMRNRDDISAFNISFPWGTMPGKSYHRMLDIIETYRWDCEHRLSFLSLQITGLRK